MSTEEVRHLAEVFKNTLQPEKVHQTIVQMTYHMPIGDAANGRRGTHTTLDDASRLRQHCPPGRVHAVDRDDRWMGAGRGECGVSFGDSFGRGC